MNLILDIGNTRTKVALFASRKSWRSEWTLALTAEWLDQFLDHVIPDATIVSVTGIRPDWLTDWLNNLGPWMELDHHARLPFSNHYQTPETLGRDRIAGLAGAIELGYHPPFLVISAGTCMTIDLMEDGRHYAGGSIHPGMRMRLEAMHMLTARLPHAPVQADPALPGRDTLGSLTAGAQWGIICEIEGMVARYRNQYPELNVIITGGDMEFLASRLNSVIFAHAELVLIGLNQILNHALEAE